MAWDAASYDRKFAFVTDGGAPILARLAPQPGERVLDLGCGTGELTAQISSAGAAVVGLDADEAMLNRARERFPGITFVCAAAEDAAWPRTLPPFDALFSNAALHWMKPVPVLRQARSALVSGGRFVGEFGGWGNVAAVLNAIARSREQAGLPPRQPPWFFPSLATWADLLEETGFEPRWLELLDRPTPIPTLEGGILDWLRMFAGRLFEDLDPAHAPEVMSVAVELARPALFRANRWIVDYRRLRFEAVAR
jgi:trans-aconitate methyltransferase